MKPGISSRKPATTVRNPGPSSSTRVTVASPNAERARATSPLPALRITAAPASDVMIVSATAGRKPIDNAITTNTTSSASGSASSPKIAHFSNDIGYHLS